MSYQARINEGGFSSFNERIDAHKVRERSESFNDHFSQAKLFFNSQTPTEKSHIVRALRFELGKVKTTAIRVRMLGLLSQVDSELADKVAQGLGATIPTVLETPVNHGVSPENDMGHEQSLVSSYALSMLKNPTNSTTIASRKVAFVCADGVSEIAVLNMKNALLKEDAKGIIIAPHLGSITTDAGGEIAVDFSFLTASSVLFDAVYVVDGLGLTELAANDDVNEFLNDAYKHCKVIGADGEAIALLSSTPFAGKISNNDDAGLIISSEAATETFAQSFIAAMGNHRFWEREVSLF
jgi:catalase